MGDPIPFPYVGQIVRYITWGAEHRAALVTRIDPQNARIVSLHVFDPWNADQKVHEVSQDEGQKPGCWYFVSEAVPCELISIEGTP